MLSFKKVGICLGVFCVVFMIVEEFITTTKHKFSDIAEMRNSSTINYRNITGASNVQDNSEERRLRESPFIYRDDMDRARLLPQPSQPTVKLVSTYIPWDLQFKDRHKNRFTGCLYNNCQYVVNMSEADAVIFRAPSVREHVIPNFHRPKGQRWILYTMDPALKNYGLGRPDVKSKFNWTVTYQLRSDFPILFGLLKKRVPPSRDFETLYDNKDRDAAWFVSHCRTWGLREQYVKRMIPLIEVDIFGKCGNMTCAGPFNLRENDRTDCLPMLTNRYKFYLAFENSFCKDYITEKFFKLFNEVDIIPVVRGGFNYKKYLPSGIFVDSSDFKTPEDLARHLVWLGQNKTEYVAMLKRKSQWVMALPESFHCRICQKLHTSNLTSEFHSNLETFFRGDPPDCWKPTDLEQ